MKPFLFLASLILPLLSHSQSKVNILDFFYEALSKDNTEPMGAVGKFLEIELNNYDNEIVDPAAIIKRHPDAVKYLREDGYFYIKCPFYFQGNVKDLGYFDPRIKVSKINFEKELHFILNIYSELENEVFDLSVLQFDSIKSDSNFLIWGGNARVDFTNSDIYSLLIVSGAFNAPRLRIIDNYIDILQIDLVSIPHINIEKNKLGLTHLLEIQSKETNITANEFNPKDLSLSDLFQGPLERQNLILQQKSIVIASDDYVINKLNIKHNVFHFGKGNSAVLFAQKSNKMAIEENTFKIPLILSSIVDAGFVLNNNQFESISMGAAMPSTPQHQVFVNWKELKGKMMWQSDENKTPYWGIGDEDLANSRSFFGLISNHSRLLEVFKNYGNMDDANDVFLDMKALHLKRYDYLYRTEGGTTNFFRLYLNKLLNVYTRHGTDPAQAMTASLWIIIFFSIIYFFFPSDWDKASKAKLIRNFQTFVEKNEHGYFRPFMKMVAGIMASFFNAITLSVNSFVTLGFGMIPTKGLAKYICIFQGFLGWFLLSIFIVALINQILV